MRPCISIVIPLYNKGPYIARALNSVLSQSFSNFEIIVVDDGSIDDGAVIVKGFGDPHIRLIQQKNQGEAAARNKGIEDARADLIAFLDADDEWMAEHLETLFYLWKKYPEAGAYGTAYLIQMNSSDVRVASISNVIPKKPWEGLIPSYFKAAALGDAPITSSTVAIPKEVLKRMSGFNTSAWWGDDTDLWGRIALKYPIAFSWEGAGIYHTEAANRALKRIKSVKENIFIDSARKAIEAGEIPLEIQDDLHEYMANKQIQTACQNLKAGRPDLAKQNLMNCKTKYLWKSKYWILFWAYVPSGIYLILRDLKSKVIEKI